MSTSSPPKKAPRTDPESALEALKRARKRAEKIAAATNTAVIHWENGKIVRVYPGRKADADTGSTSTPE